MSDGPIKTELELEQAEEEIASLQEDIFGLKFTCANHHANVNRIIEWINDPKRKPAVHAFTEGPERQIAYAVERLKESK